MAMRENNSIRFLAMVGIFFGNSHCIVAQEVESNVVQLAPTPRIANRPLDLFALPTRTEVASPQDEKSAPAVGAPVGNPIQEDKADASLQADDPQTTTALVLDRPLSLDIRVVDTSAGELGSGLMPGDEEAVPVSEPVLLPNGLSRGAAYKCVHWRASGICHVPLFFEDAMLERHGQSRFGHLQPLVSGVKFFTTIPLLPYLNTLTPACEPKYALGHYRPGSCAPILKDHLPWDKRAAAVETLSAAGFFWAAPL